MDLGVIFWLIIGFPILWAVGMKIFFHIEYTWSEFLAQCILCLMVLTIFWGAFRYSDTWDTEIWNGEISAKNMVQKDCPWGWVRHQDSFCSNYQTKQVRDYPDGQTCTTDSKGRRTCTSYPRYHTEYNYDYDWERRWYVSSANLDFRYEITRVDRQGVNAPPFYTRTQVGDPASVTKGYTNWIKGASDSLFHEDGAIAEQYATLIPEYPIALYNYFHVDRVVQVGVSMPDIALWNRQLGDALKQLGPNRQMNAVIVLVDATKVGSDFPFAVRRAWNGFKKNDAVLFIGVDGAKNVQWAEVLSWSKENLFNVQLRNAILAMRGTELDRQSIISNIQTIGMASYERREMQEFEYLKNQVPVPTWLIVLEFVLGIGGSIGLSLVFLKYHFDPIGEFLSARRA